MIFSEKFIKANDNLCDFDNHVPAPYFRKVFPLDFIPEKAEITICGLGFYELYVNGRNITKGPLAPYISNPDDVCYYDNYDITTLLKKGTNSVGILLGNGFRNCFGGVVWDFEKAECRGVPITALYIEASDKENTFVLEADESFKTHSSPITFNDLRMGCRYDARLEIEDWAEVDFDDSEWDNALLCEKPKGIFKLCEAESITVTNKLSAIDIKHYKSLPYAYESTKIDALPMENTRRENVYVYDFGVNSAGVTMLKLKNTTAGQVVIVRHGEVEQIEGFSVNTTIFNRKEVVDKYLEYGQTDVYVCKGAEEEIFVPKFKYDGFRYAYVEGLTKEQADEEAVVMLVMNSDLKIKSEFECSDMVLNKLWEIARRSDLSNFYYFPTDCPHREKNGWTGDASVSAEHMLLNYKCEKSMKEWLVNIRAAQRENGAIPGIVPTGGWGYEFGSGPAWDSVCVILPYYIYKYTGNKDVIKDNASMIMSYLKYAESRCDENGLVAFGLGDWCDPFIDKNGGITAPLVLTDSLTIYDMAKKAAICFGEINQNDKKEYAKNLAEEMKKAVRSNLVDFETMRAAGDCQTSQAMALEIGIFNDDEIEKAKTNLTAYLNGEKEPKTVPKYVTSSVKIDGPVMYGTTNEHGKLEERPIIFTGFGHFIDARNDVPIFQNFGFNTAQFEIGPSNMMVNTTMASCWADAINKSPDFEGKIDTTHKRSGNSSFKLTYKSPETSGQNMYVYQFVPVTAGKSYVLSGYVKANNANKVYISARDSQERVYVDGTYDWTEVSSKYTAPADTEYTIIRIGCEGITDEVYFDDFTFCEEGSNVNILRNGDFEKAPEEIMEFNPHAKSIYDIKKVLKNAEDNNLALSVLISPHYFPTKIIEKYDIHHPKLMFLKYNINAEPAKKIIEEYVNTIIPIIREYKSVQNICLTNEPAFRVDLCGDFYLGDWHEYLKKLYDNDISKLNKAYQKDFKAFEDVDFVMTNYAKRYDFKNFNDSVFSEWHRWLAEMVTELAPDIPVQIKRMNYFEPTNSLHVYIGTDVENYYDFVQMNGCDCGDYIEDESDALVQTMWYDMLRSGKDMPVINSEDHIMLNGSDVYTDEQSIYVARNLHMGAIHGRGMSNMWVWAKSYEEGNVFADSILFRPDVLAGICDISMDMNRNSYEIAALQNAEKEVGILYSDASIISNVSTPYAVYKTYSACMYNGKAIRFIYPSQLASMNDSKVLLVPNKTHVVAETLDYISDYIKSGGKVVIIGSDSLKKNEYGYDLDAEKIKYIYDNSQVIEYSGANDKIENMTESEFYQKVREALDSCGVYNVALKDSKTGEAVDLVEYNVGYYNGKLIVNMVNYGEERNVNIYLGDKLVEKSYELYKEEELGSEITLSKYIPVFVEINVDNPFIDTYGHWAEQNISNLYSEGIVKGVKENLYAPQKTLTRAEFLALIMRCTEKAGNGTNTLPKDVMRNKWYASDVLVAVNKGIINSDENFRPEEYITREEMCTLLVKCYELENKEQIEEVQLEFTDADKITNVTDVKKAVALGLMSGHTDGRFAPVNTATRAEAAAVIERFNGK